MNTVVLTNNNSLYGKKLIQQFEKSGIPLAGIIIINQPLSYNVKLFGYVKRRVGLIQAFYFAIKAVFMGILRKTEKIKYSDFNTKSFTVKGNNSTELEQLLLKLDVDVIVLAQTGIIRNNIIKKAKKGVLNAHPGILPDYRGIDCLKWAILNNDLSKIGCTVHWVDQGVDTGNIISTHQYKIKLNLSFDELEWDLYLQCINELVKAVSMLENGEPIKSTPQAKDKGKQYYKMPLSKEILANKLLRKLSHDVT